MIKPLLEGFDAARRPLLFYVEFWPVARCKRRVGLNCQNLAMWAASGSAICAANSRKQLRQLAPAAIAGVPRVVYLDAASTMLFLGRPRCLEELRRCSPRQRVSPRSEAGRAVARTLSIVNQVR